MKLNPINLYQDQPFGAQYLGEKEIGRTLLYAFITASSVIAVISVFNVELYKSLITEDGMLEYASALFWLFAAIIMLLHNLKLIAKKSNKYELILNFLLMLFFVACFGEEISWGQRIFGYGTPKLIGEANVQNEMNLHDIGHISIFSNAFFSITILFFIVAPFLARKRYKITDKLKAFHFPVPSNHVVYIYIVALMTWIFIGLRFGTLGFDPYSFYHEHYYTQMDDEFFEFAAAYAFLCFSIIESTKRPSPQD